MVVAEVGSPMTDSEDLTGKTITVVGLGKSGMAAVRFLQGKGARIRVADHRSLSDLSQQLSQLDQETVEVFSGERFEEGFHNSDVVVISPGVPSDMEI
ncbi:MAG: NAD(P)-dependent oxidoreductase, partial [Nitrospirae bacterium]|nr:NAD(P)-dependent oxidoreductase [Nitrospirota bacterium]